MIALAERISRSARRSGTGKRAPKAAAKRRSRSGLAARRERLFERKIDFVPCRAFRGKNADRLASEPPAAAAVPLARNPAEVPAGNRLSPYLADLYRTRLLSKAEEEFYFRRMNWLKYRAASQRSGLDRCRASQRQVAAVEVLLTEADEVKSILVTSNLRLVVSIAKKFNDPSLSFDELVGEGNVALLRAVEKFDFSLGNRFSTYATYAIQRHFFRLSHKGRQLRSRFVLDDNAFKGRAAPAPDGEQRTDEQIGQLERLFAGFLAKLDPREREIVIARFGFDGVKPRTFRELGSTMGVCKERIRQIQSRAMEKLRALAAGAKLEQTVGDWL